MLQWMLVQGVRNMQPADEYECRDILTAIRNFGRLALEVTDVRVETVLLPHFDGEEVVVLLGFPVRGALGEHIGYLLEVVESMLRQGVKSICNHAFQDGRKC